MDTSEPEDVKSMIKQIHAMTSEFVKAKKDKKNRIEARLNADPMARRPGRPRKPELKKIDGQQEFINTKGEKILLDCLPKESKHRNSDHVRRICMAYDILKGADVKVTVKNIRLLGIGAGTFLDNKNNLPAYILMDLQESASPHTGSSLLHRKGPSLLTHTGKCSEPEQEENEYPEDIKDENDDIVQDDRMGSPLPLRFEVDEEEFNNQFNGNGKSDELQLLLNDRRFKDAILIVDGVFGVAEWTKGSDQQQRFDAALPFVDEVQRQRRLRGLPLVNMRAVR